MQNKKIGVITTSHNRNDTRIFIRQVSSLKKHFIVHFFVADGLGDEKKENLIIKDFGREKSRFKRFFFKPVIFLFYIIKEKIDIVHIHDPELLLIVIPLKLFQKKVIFDSHEDYTAAIKDRPYLKANLRLIIGNLFYVFERFVVNFIDVMIGATPFITEKFHYHKHPLLIANYPSKQDLYKPKQDYIKTNQVTYVGNMSEERGIFHLVEAMDGIKEPIKLNLIGSFSESDFELRVKKLKGFSNVNFLGIKNRREVSEILRNSFAGIVTFLPRENHINAQPNKLFEYFSVGIPVICSNFPLWKKIIKNELGFSVNPEDSLAIKERIEFLYENQENIGFKMGSLAQKEFLERYNWETEEKKLINLYQELLK